MNLKRFRYENGLDIIVPLKHGTRWLEEKTNPISIEEIYSTKDVEAITKETYWVYREPKKHMLSALRTEIRTGIEFNGDSKDTIIDKFKTDKGLHWSPTLYESIYKQWDKIGFNLIHLKDLSNLFIDIEYDSNEYDFHNFKKAKHTAEDIIELVGSMELNTLYMMCDSDELWLKRILNNEKGLTSYDLSIQKEKIIDNYLLIQKEKLNNIETINNVIMTGCVYMKKFLILPKCGSRFFDEHFGNRKILKPGSKLGSSNWIDVINKEEAGCITKLKKSKFIDEIEWIVLREPIEYMKTAVHTEFINFWNGGNVGGNKTEKDVLLKFIINTESNLHWNSNIFRELYLFTLQFKKPPTIIMLDNLNHFVENVLNETYSTGFTKTKYDFSDSTIYISKDDLWNIYIKHNYPKEWKMLSKLLEGDMFFWNKLIQLCPKYNIKNTI